jgi:separase
VQAAIKTLESLTLCESATSRLNAVLSSSDVLVGLTLSMNRDALILWQVTPSRQPFAMRLSIPAEGPSSYASVMQRLRKILSTMKTMTVSDGVLSTKEKKAWWTKRFALDHKLGQLMVDVEDEWLGDARIFLLPASFRGDTVFHSSAPCAAFGAAAAHFPELVSSSSIESVLDRSYPEDDNSVSAPLVESMVARAQRNTSEAAKVTTSQRAKRTRQSKRTVARKGDSATLETVSGELLLAVDTELECLPWESLPVLRAAKCGVSRLPHESFLLPSSPTMDVDPSSVFYLLNPSGDLRATQETFQEVFESQYGWTGNVGVEAKKCGMDETMAKLDLSDVFVYCGHGGGEALVPPRRLATSVPRVPVSILMGCSSGRLEQFSGGAESSGTAVEYLLAGAPAVVANMWDVSDRDIDRLTGSLLTNWIGIPSVVEETRAVDEEGLSVGECSLSVALARSRDACRLPYLVGASTVLYGNGWIRCAD